MMEKRLILFDGSCGFCNSTMMYIANRDRDDKFRFVSNLSEKGKQLLLQFQLEGLESSTLILLKEDKVYLEAKAFREISKELPHHQFLASLITITPYISDVIYRLISRIRKKIPGAASCDLPDFHIRTKFTMN